MCLGTIEQLTETWDEEGRPMGRTERGAVVSLAFAPEARAEAYVLLYAGCVVEVPRSARRG